MHDPQVFDIGPAPPKIPIQDAGGTTASQEEKMRENFRERALRQGREREGVNAADITLFAEYIQQDNDREGNDGP